jgi:hypothetical protein
MIKLILMIICFIGGAAEEIFSQEMLTRKQMVQDLDGMVNGIAYSHVNPYATRSKEEWGVFMDEMKAGLPDSLSKFDFWRRAEQVLVFMNDAHTRTYPWSFRKEYIDHGGKFFPFTISKKDDGYYTSKIYGDVKGISTTDRIVSINDIPIETIYAAMKKQCGKELDFLDEKAICGSFPYYIWKVYGWEPPYAVVYSDSELPVAIEGITYEELNKEDAPSPGREICSLSYLNGTSALLTVRDFETEPRSYYNTFYRKAFRELNRKGIKNIVLDLRGNDGGDSRYAEDFAAWFADKPFRIASRTMWKVTPEFRKNFGQLYIPGYMRWAKFLYFFNEHANAIRKAKDGTIAVVEHKERKPRGSALEHPKKVYVLIDNDTFSAGSMFAAMVKDYKLGILVGQPTGNLSSFYADPLIWYRLPNSGITFQVSTSFNVRPNGVADKESIQPNIMLPQGADALEYVMKLLGD